MNRNKVLMNSIETLELWDDTPESSTPQKYVSVPRKRASAIKDSPKIIHPKLTNKPNKTRKRSETNLTIKGEHVVSESVSMMPHRPYPVEMSNSPKICMMASFPALMPKKTPFFAQRGKSNLSKEIDTFKRKETKRNLRTKLRFVFPPTN